MSQTLSVGAAGLRHSVFLSVLIIMGVKITMSETMTLPYLSNHSTLLSKMIARDRERFIKRCNREFLSGRDMADRLAEAGFIIGEKRCERIRNRTARKIYNSEVKAVQYALRRERAIARSQSVSARIAELEDELEQLKSVRRP